MKESSAKRLRRNKDYYLKELKNNAKRNKIKGYDVGRNNEILTAHKKRREDVGNYGKRNWTDKEIKFLEDNQGANYSKIAIELNRSLSSIEHKIIRLGLQKYNKW